MRRCRKPGGFAAVFGFLRRLPAAGGVVPRVFWPECGRNGGGVLWEAWKARTRALRVRWAWCGGWMGARTPFPPFPQATRSGGGGCGKRGKRARVPSIRGAVVRNAGGGARAPFPPFPHQSPCGKRWAWRMGPRRAGRHRAVRRRPSLSDQSSSGRTGCGWRTIAHSRRNSLSAMLRCRRAVVFPASFNFRL